MSVEASVDQAETRFLEGVEERPIQVAALLTCIEKWQAIEPAKSSEWTLILLQELVDREDFVGAVQTVRARVAQLQQVLQASDVAALLKRCAKERLHTAMLASFDFAGEPLVTAIARLSRLLALEPGVMVLDATWGVGIVKRLDDFYKRVTVDFTGKNSHAMSFATASEALNIAPEDHLLTLLYKSVQCVADMAVESPGELVKWALRDFGNMSVAKLEITLTSYGIVAAANWKEFWAAARKALKGDPLVVVPAKRSDEVQLLATVESYGSAWFAKLADTKDPTLILEAITQLESAGKLENLTDEQRRVLEQRVGSALIGAHNSDAAMYARLAVAAIRIGMPSPSAEQMRDHLWEGGRYLAAANELGIRDTAAMVEFLLAEGRSAVGRLLEDLPLMCYTMLNETLTLLREEHEAARVCGQLLAQPNPPVALVYWYFRTRAGQSWQLPALPQMLGHAIAIAERSLSGEALRMQNGLKQMFTQAKWLSTIFEELNAPQRKLIFERVQASKAWDALNHRAIIGRMIKIDPSLADHKRVVSTLNKDEPQLTSWRSLRERERQYKQLVEVEIAKNSQDIAVARSYGDLRENFEYQAAKDMQRQLLQRQSEMQLELKRVKGTDFAGVGSGGRVEPGVTVTLSMSDGSKRVYTILGEWDSDATLNIISNRTRLAEALLGRVPGDSTTIPGIDGNESAVIEGVRPYGEDIRAWING